MTTRSTLKFKMFRGTLISWDQLFTDAAAFAATIGRERVATISHSSDHSDGIVTVWYWSAPGDLDG